MNNLNISRKLVSILPNNSVATLLQANSALHTQVERLRTDNYFWLLKFENDFDITIPTNEYNKKWKDIHTIASMSGLYGLLVSGDISFLRVGLVCDLSPDLYTQAFLASTDNRYDQGTQLERVTLLLADPRVDPSDQGNKAIINAVAAGNEEMVALLLQDKRVDPSDQGNKAIINAVVAGNEEMVALLLQDKRVDPSDQGNKAIIQASLHGHTEILRMLLANFRVNPSAVSNLAIKLAAREGRFEAVRLLLQDSRVDPTANQNRALELAIEKGHYDVADVLLDNPRVRNLWEM